MICHKECRIFLDCENDLQTYNLDFAKAVSWWNSCNITIRWKGKGGLGNETPASVTLKKFCSSGFFRVWADRRYKKVGSVNKKHWCHSKQGGFFIVKIKEKATEIGEEANGAIICKSAK